MRIALVLAVLAVLALGAGRWRRFLLVLPVAALATGCTALRSPHEQAWLALHAVDTAQTVDIAHDPCYIEAHPVTRALIGERPSDAQVAAWAIGTAALHVGVTQWLLDHYHPKLARAWSYVTIGEKAWAIGHNISLGIRLGAPNKSYAGCVR